jgi:transcription antitermination protein NusB
MQKRRKAREAALKLLYQYDLSGNLPEDILESTDQLEGMDSESAEYARGAFLGAVANVKAIDLLIQEASRKWKLPRIAALDRNLLRLAVFELLHRPDIPAAVIIDEALEIAKKYSDEDAPRFINGVLDGILHSRMEGRVIKT